MDNDNNDDSDDDEADDDILGRRNRGWDATADCQGVAKPVGWSNIVCSQAADFTGAPVSHNDLDKNGKPAGGARRLIDDA